MLLAKLPSSTLSALTEYSSKHAFSNPHPHPISLYLISFLTFSLSLSLPRNHVYRCDTLTFADSNVSRCIFRYATVNKDTIQLDPSHPFNQSSLHCSSYRFPTPPYCTVDRTQNLLNGGEYVKNAILLRPLNTHNYSHGIFDDLLSIVRGLVDAIALTLFPSLTPSSLTHREVRAAFNALTREEWHIYLLDDHLLPQVREVYTLLLPKAKIFTRPQIPLSFVRMLVVGTGGICPNHGHCPRDILDHYDDGFIPMLVRNTILKNSGVVTRDFEVTRPHCPKVTIVQRKGSRKIQNIKEIENYVRKPCQQSSVQVIQLEIRSGAEQATLFHQTDIAIYVHGGAMANVLFLPAGAAFLQINPYGMHSLFHPYIINVADAYRQLNLTFDTIETFDGRLQSLETPCPLIGFHECATHHFDRLFSMTVDMEQFREKYNDVLQKWRAGEATDPLLWRRHLTEDEVFGMFSAGKEMFEKYTVGNKDLGR